MSVHIGFQCLMSNILLIYTHRNLGAYNDEGIYDNENPNYNYSKAFKRMKIIYSSTLTSSSFQRIS